MYLAPRSILDAVVKSLRRSCSNVYKSSDLSVLQKVLGGTNNSTSLRFLNQLESLRSQSLERSLYVTNHQVHRKLPRSSKRSSLHMSKSDESSPLVESPQAASDETSQKMPFAVSDSNPVKSFVPTFTAYYVSKVIRASGRCRRVQQFSVITGK